MIKGRGLLSHKVRKPIRYLQMDETSVPLRQKTKWASC